MDRFAVALLMSLLALAAAACNGHTAAQTLPRALNATASATPSVSPSFPSDPQASPSTEAGASSTPSPQASPSAEAALSPNPFPTCPALIHNRSGAYSFNCTANWKYANCDASSSNPYTWLVNPQGCLWEQYQMRMMVWSLQGDHSADPENGIGSSVGQRQSSQQVVVSNVAGTRRTYLVTATNGISPPQGTVQVLYTFVTGGRTYFAEDDRYPGDQDLTAPFDHMITTSLRFAA